MLSCLRTSSFSVIRSFMRSTHQRVHNCSLVIQVSSFSTLLRGGPCASYRTLVPGNFHKQSKTACLVRYAHTKDSNSSQTDGVDPFSTSDSKFVHGFSDVPELQNAPEEVQKMFSLDNANQKEKRKVISGKITAKYRNEYLLNKVAELTLKIKSVEKHMSLVNNCRKDKHNKVFLLWLIDQRKKQLKKLRDQKFELYLDIIKELDIPPLDSPFTKWNKYKFRKFKIGVDIKDKKTFKDEKVVS